MIRDSFVAAFGEEQAVAIERAAEEHKNGVHDNRGSDSFKWAIAICIGYECMEVDACKPVVFEQKWGGVPVLLCCAIQAQSREAAIKIASEMRTAYLLTKDSERREAGGSVLQSDGWE